MLIQNSLSEYDKLFSPTKLMKKTSIKPTVSVTIPVFNNEKTIIGEIKGCKNILSKYCDKFEIIVGEDKSTDKTRTLLKKYYGNDKHIRLLFYHANKGVAGNIKHLYAQARYQYILLYVGDGDWRLQDIEILLKTLLSTQADVVIGKRIKKGGYTIYRQVVTFLHKFLPRLLFGVDTVDAGSIKIYSKELFTKLPIISKSIFHDAEFIIRAKRSGAVIATCPVSYQKPKKSSGTAANVRMLLPAFADMLKLRFKI